MYMNLKIGMESVNKMKEKIFLIIDTITITLWLIIGIRNFNAVIIDKFQYGIVWVLLMVFLIGNIIKHFDTETN